ncbi:MAG: alpha-glucosidase [Pseudomonadota bacterium]
MDEWWRRAVIYQIYPRSFYDTNGDGIGDLPGICEKLDYVADLGVDAIWISPFFTSPMKDFGYDVADYRSVDPIFGTLDDFDQLLARAHALGLKVIIDQVYSHTSDQHQWFQESRGNGENSKADWYVWADPKPDGSPPNNWQSVFSGPSWTWDSGRGQYYFHNFLPGQPDLNLHKSEVQAALLDVARFWLDRGVDGFRLDAINFAMHDPDLRDNPPADRRTPGARTFDYQVHKYNQSQPEIVGFLEKLRDLTDAYGARFTLAEIGGLDQFGEAQAFTNGNNRLNSAYSFHYLYTNKIEPTYIRQSYDDWPSDTNAGWPSWAFSNHDAPRCVSRWYDGPNLDQYAKLMALILLTLRGTPILYQGEELGLPQADIPFDKLQDPEAIANWPKTLGRDGARTPMPWAGDISYSGFSTMDPWLPVDERHLPLAVDQQVGEAASVLSFVRQLLQIRRSAPGLQVGDIDFLDAPENIIAFTRTHGEEAWLVAANLGDAPCHWQPGSITGEVQLATTDLDQHTSRLPRQIGAHAGYLARLSSALHPGIG